MSVVDKIVNEWAFRCKKGYPDMNNPDDMKILKEIYSEFGISMEATTPRKSLYDIHKDYVHIDFPGKDEDYYVHISDFDEKTKKVKPGAKYYIVRNKETKAGKIPYIYKEADPFKEPEIKQEKSKEEKEKERQQQREKDTTNRVDQEEIAMVRQQLKNAGVPDNLIEKTIGTAQIPNPNFRALSGVQDFIEAENFKNSIENFGYLYKYQILRGGKGELIPFVAIRGAKLGGPNEKDIVDRGGTVLEVKELPGKGNKREFALASGASVAGSTFVEHLQTFLKAIWPYRTSPHVRGIEKLKSLDSVSPGYLADLQGILNNFPYSEKDLTSDAQEIKINGKKYSVKKGVPYSIQLDDDGNLIPNQNAPVEANTADIEMRKLLNHPWIKKGTKETPMGDLEKVRQAYLKTIDYLMLWTSESSAVIVDPTLPEQASKIGISRVATGNLSLTYFVDK